MPYNTLLLLLLLPLLGSKHQPLLLDGQLRDVIVVTTTIPQVYHTLLVTILPFHILYHHHLMKLPHTLLQLLTTITRIEGNGTIPNSITTTTTTGAAATTTTTTTTTSSTTTWGESGTCEVEGGGGTEGRGVVVEGVVEEGELWEEEEE